MKPQLASFVAGEVMKPYVYRSLRGRAIPKGNWNIVGPAP